MSRDLPLTARLPIPEAMRDLCRMANVAPGVLLTGFMNDLLRLPQSHGSDEREFACAYLLRMIGHYVPYEKYLEIEEFLRTDRQRR